MTFPLKLRTLGLSSTMYCTVLGTVHVKYTRGKSHKNQPKYFGYCLTYRYVKLMTCYAHNIFIFQDIYYMHIYCSYYLGSYLSTTPYCVMSFDSHISYPRLVISYALPNVFLNNSHSWKTKKESLSTYSDT